MPPDAKRARRSAPRPRRPEDGAWGRWARFVNRRPLPVALAGIGIVGALTAVGTQLNPNEAQLKSFPGHGDAIAGRDQLLAAGISAGVMKPFDVLVEHGADPETVAARLRGVAGIAGAVAPRHWRRGGDSIVEAFPAMDGAAGGIQGIVDRVNGRLDGTDATLGGTAAADRDFVHAVYRNLPYVLAFVILLTIGLRSR
jgi:putative drug exporter of the RND superfamily